MTPHQLSIDGVQFADKANAEPHQVGYPPRARRAVHSSFIVIF